MLLVSGLGLAAASVGVAAYAKIDYDDAVSKHDIARANRDGNTADFASFLGVASVASLGVAAYLHWIAPSRTIVAPGMTASSAGISVVGSF